MFRMSGEKSLEQGERCVGVLGLGGSWIWRVVLSPQPTCTPQVASIFPSPHSTSHTGHFQQGAEV